jgi:hypothetical protein
MSDDFDDRHRAVALEVGADYVVAVAKPRSARGESRGGTHAAV